MNHTLGPYTLLKRLAVGGMAEIYIAKAQGLGGFEKLVAVKVIHPQFASKESFIRMLIEEAKLCVLLTHRNIGQIFDLGCVNDTYFIVMEYIHGADCASVLRWAARANKKLPIEMALYIAYEAAQGLHFAHTQSDLSGEPLNIVHRDVSPHNILLSRLGEVKVVDFGIAKAALRGEITGTGVIKGKYSYMSPEQARQEPATVLSDVFSNSAVLYELLTGVNIYAGTPDILLFEKAQSGDIADVQRLRPDLPQAIADIVRKGLQKDPALRFQSASEMAAAIAAVSHSLGYVLQPDKLIDCLNAMLGPAEEDFSGQRVATQAELPSRRDVSIITDPTVFDVPQPHGSTTTTTGVSAAAQPKKERPTLRPAAIGPRARGRIEAPRDPTSRHDSSLSTAQVAIAPATQRERSSTLPPPRRDDAAPLLLPRLPIQEPAVPTPPLYWNHADSPGLYGTQPGETLPYAPPLPIKALRQTAGQRLKANIFAVSAALAVCFGVYYWLVHRNLPRSEPTLEIISVPVGAEVWIDGIKQPGLAPLYITTPLQNGTAHLLEVRLDGYERWSKRISASTDRVTEIVTLKPEKMLLEVITHPEGAQIWVNGELRGTSPVDVYIADADQAMQLRVSLAGYQDEIRDIHIERNRLRQQAIIELEPEHLGARSRR